MKISLASLEINYICFIKKNCILYVLRLFALYILDRHICILFRMHLLLAYGHFIWNAPFVLDNLVKGGWRLNECIEQKCWGQRSQGGLNTYGQTHITIFNWLITYRNIGEKEFLIYRLWHLGLLVHSFSFANTAALFGVCLLTH